MISFQWLKKKKQQVRFEQKRSNANSIWNMFSYPQMLLIYTLGLLIGIKHVHVCIVVQTCQSPGVTNTINDSLHLQ